MGNRGGRHPPGRDGHQHPPVRAGLGQEAGHEYGLANPAPYAARSTRYDITKTDLANYPAAVRSDYRTGVDTGNGYRYSVRWFDHDEKLTIHVRPAYDDSGESAPRRARRGSTPWLPRADAQLMPLA